MRGEEGLARVEQHIRHIEELMAEALTAAARQESPNERAFLAFLSEALALSREHLARLKSE
ncbi:hypothetical protein EN844_09055 [Mesorhizobium sp. M3A.F.Ca.ET.201.01.1.1]|uniref:hypothetical protein n=1 Tax=Mesorhizobium sp. M3A.F.Ca.ET.201.01.1.1 TaxID=2563946 RepID=UPI001093D129|nr:hypothetical protein [Mesorhizobium sp. M3A.F.Ca.ET.201.01.1.1]TGS69015.1 hypothetical protein EN844_09055 [Mesorhizobium sp. M3A.F.Ca.ET.201.01.1.1]